MWARIRLLGLALGVSLASCGGNGLVIISINSGVIIGNPLCQGPGGQFQLRDQGGLTVVVVITSTTHIVVAGGGTGTCTDLSAGTPVQVSGRQSGERIVANSVTIAAVGASRIEHFRPREAASSATTGFSYL